MAKTRIGLFFALSVLMLLGVACSGGGNAAPTKVAPAPDSQQSATLAPSPAPTEVLAARVNGQAVTLAMYQDEIVRQEARLADAGVVPADRAAFEASVLTTILDQMLIEQAAHVQGLTVTDEEVEAEIAIDIELVGGEETWRAWLAQNLLSEEEYRDSIRSALLTAKIRDLVVAGVPQAVDQVHARHILVSTEAEAQQIYQQLLAGSEFGELALQYSRDVSTREMGGDLGWFTREQLTEPVVAETAFSQEAGQLSEPVVSRLGYHIIQTLERVSDRPLDDMTRASLLEMTFERWRQSLWDQATIERFIGG